MTSKNVRVGFVSVTGGLDLRAVEGDSVVGKAVSVEYPRRRKRKKDEKK